MDVMPLKNSTAILLICYINFGALILKSFIFPALLPQPFYLLCQFSSSSSLLLIYVKASPANITQSTPLKEKDEKYQTFFTLRNANVFHEVRQLRERNK
jgi:hypothetical protein